MTTHKKIESNKFGNDYVVGDIHGCYDTLQLALKLIGFDKERDRLFSVGDLVDRGNKSEECAMLLLEPWFYAVRGNHEQMAIYYLEYETMDSFTYRANGGDWFVDLCSSMQNYYVQLFEEMPLAITIDDTYGIVHAEPPRKSWFDFLNILDSEDETNEREHMIFQAIWGRTRIRYKVDTMVEDVEHIFCGHTVLKEPYISGNVIYIDTGCVFGNRLTIFNLDGTVKIQVPKQYIE